MVFPRIVSASALSVPDLSGRVVLVTGATSGLGFEASKVLAAYGAHVFITGRNKERGLKAVERLEAEKPRGKIEFLECELKSLRSVAKCAEGFLARGLPLHVLMSNAGVETPPDPKSEDGFEATMATNYVGAFYLTHLLLQRVQESKPSRIVQTGSLVEAHGDFDTPDILGRNEDAESDYRAYARSKLCSIMMCGELQRRLGGPASGVDVLVGHPGIAKTAIFSKSDRGRRPFSLLLDIVQRVAAQPADKAAKAILKCATDLELEGTGGTDRMYGAYYFMLPYKYLGILGLVTTFNNTGYRRPQNALIHDPAACARLYDQTLDAVNEAARRAGIPEISAAGTPSSTAGSRVAARL